MSTTIFVRPTTGEANDAEYEITLDVFQEIEREDGTTDEVKVRTIRVLRSTEPFIDEHEKVQEQTAREQENDLHKERGNICNTIFQKIIA